MGLSTLPFLCHYIIIINYEMLGHDTIGNGWRDISVSSSDCSTPNQFGIIKFWLLYCNGGRVDLSYQRKTIIIPLKIKLEVNRLNTHRNLTVFEF